MTGMKQSSKTAFGGILTALSVVLMFLTGVIPFLTFALPALAGALLILIVTEIGSKWALCVYAAVSILSLLVVADKEAAMLTQEQALEKAIAHFKVDAAAITNLQIYQENDDGIQVYDIEFVYDGKEYSAEVDVTSGAITSSDIDTIH